MSYSTDIHHRWGIQTIITYRNIRHITHQKVVAPVEHTENDIQRAAQSGTANANLNIAGIMIDVLHRLLPKHHNNRSNTFIKQLFLTYIRLLLQFFLNKNHLSFLLSFFVDEKKYKQLEKRIFFVN